MQVLLRTCAQLGALQSRAHGLGSFIEGMSFVFDSKAALIVPKPYIISKVLGRRL